MGKGSIRRPTDDKKFGENYDRIFGKRDDDQIGMDFNRPAVTTKDKGA